MAKGGGSTRKTGTKVSAKTLSPKQANRAQTLNRAGMFTGKGTSKVGGSK